MTEKNNLAPRSGQPNEYSQKKMTMLLARYSNHFRNERSEDDWTALFKDYGRLLADLQYEMIEKACLNLWRTKTWFPKVAEIRDEVERLEKARHDQTKQGEEPLHVRLDREAKGWVKSFMVGDLGRQAKQEGWANKLSGYMLSAVYQALLHAHQTGKPAQIPTSVSDDVIARYRAMYPPLARSEGSQFEEFVDRATGRWTATI